MDVRNCPKCGKMFTYLRTPICADCQKREDDEFNALKNFIEENTDSTLAEISEGTGVSPKKILRYIKEGRLEITKGMKGEVTCESCGKPIRHGRYCDACVIKINQDVSDLFHGEPIKKTNTGAKMHIQPRRL